MTAVWSERGDGWYEDDTDEDEFDDRPEHDAAICGLAEESCQCGCADCESNAMHGRGSWDWFA